MARCYLGSFRRSGLRFRRGLALSSFRTHNPALVVGLGLGRSMSDSHISITGNNWHFPAFSGPLEKYRARCLVTESVRDTNATTEGLTPTYVEEESGFGKQLHREEM